MSDTRAKRPGRNDPCPCGSSKKYKRCCLSGVEAAEREARAEEAAELPPPATEEQSTPRAPKPPRPVDQPWRRSPVSHQPFQRFMTPPKHGGG